MTGQPKPMPSNRETSRPPTNPPNGAPVRVGMMNVARKRRGAYSPAKVAADGKAPLSPIPVKKRHRLSVTIEPAKAFSSEVTPTIATLASNSGRRPMRSPIGPAKGAPTTTPTLDHRNASAKAGGGRFQVWVSGGTAQPIEPTS